jgi:integral membrane sensor domain MASE1
MSAQPIIRAGRGRPFGSAQTRTPQYAVAVAVVALAYYLVGRLALELAYLDGAVAAMWLPAGLGLAVLVL